MVIEYASLASALIALSDVVLRAAARAPGDRWRSAWDRFDCIVVATNFGCTLLLCAGGVGWPHVSTWLKLSRPLRVLRLASLTPTIKRFFKLVAPIAVIVARFGAVYWLFACARRAAICISHMGHALGICISRMGCPFEHCWRGPAIGHMRLAMRRAARPYAFPAWAGH